MKTSILQRISVTTLFCILLHISATAQTLFQENFNGNGIPAGWIVQDEGVGACSWMIHAPHTANGVNISMLQNNYLFVNSDSSGPLTVAKETITSPVINSGSASVLLLSFTHYYRDRNGINRRDTGFVDVYNGTDWVTIKTIADETIGAGDDPFKEKINITAYQNPALQVRFRYVSNRAFYWAIDDLNVYIPASADVGITNLTPPPACGMPTVFPVTVQISNFGSAAQTNFPVSYQANSLAPVTETFTGTLAIGETTNYTFQQSFTSSSAGSFGFMAWTGAQSDTNNLNDSLQAGPYIRPASSTTNNSFTGFNGTNLNVAFPGWTEAGGLIPGGTTAAWLSSSATQTTAFGGTSAKVNLFGATRKEWIISPPVNSVAGTVVRFKTAVTNVGIASPDSMGSDDSLVVKVTTDCGATWNRVYWLTSDDELPNQFTPQLVDLSAFAGQTIRVGFYATEGSINNANDFDIHIDDIEILVPSPTDLGVTQVILPNLDCGAPLTFPVRIRIYNNGNQAQTSIPASFQIGNQPPVNETFTGNIQPGQSAEFLFSTPGSIPNPGTYNFAAWTSLAGDNNLVNDSVTGISITRAPNNFATTTFSGFTGANLSTVFPGWEEKSGMQPTGTSSAWTNSAAAQTTAFGGTSAKINLYTTSRQEWLISPSFNPEPGMLFRFKAAVTNYTTAGVDSMGTDDSVHVMVTSDCGSTWTKVKTFSRLSELTNQFSTHVIPLGIFTGKTLRVAFYATDGPIDDSNDYDFHIDDVEVFLPQNKDVAVTDLLFPDANCGIQTGFPLQVRLTNFGAEAQTGFPVFYQIDGGIPISQTFSGTLLPGEVQDFSFSGLISSQPATTYSFRSWSALAGDADVSNDTTSKIFATSPTELPLVTFTGYDGTNLGSIASRWQEMTGQTPTGTTSTWQSSTATQTASLGSATARIGLSGNTKRDWIAGPAVIITPTSVLKFKVAITDRSFSTTDEMGSDDSVNVMVSTDCGLTWARLQSFTAASSLSNNLSAFSLPLGGYAGQSIRIAFFASEGIVNNTQDYDFHLDDISVSIETAVEPPHALVSHDLSIWPNPAAGEFTISISEASSQNQIQIFNIEGKCVYMKELDNSKTTVQSKGWLPGYYRVVVGTPGKVYTKSLIVK